MPTTLDNPFAKPSPYDKFALPVTNFGATPSVAQFGDTKVVTNKPILTNALPTNKFARTKSQAEIDFNSRMKFNKGLEDYRTKQIVDDKIVDDKTVVSEEPKTSWWSKKTKTQKGLIIGGGVVGIGLISFLIYKAVKK
jgi:hypothetical protein